MTLIDTRRIAAVSLAAAAIALFFGNVVGNTPEENGGVEFLLISIAVCALLGYWLFTRVLPRAIEAGPAVAAKRALILAGVSVLSWGLFWSGLPFVIAPAAIALGVSARSRGGGNLATAAIVIAAIALLASAGMVVADEFDAV